MNAFQVLSDSCSDYTNETDLSFIRRVPLTIQLEEKTYVDTEALDCLGLLEDMAVTPSAPHSACPAVGAWMDAFEESEGDIYIVTLSAQLSGSYNSAVVAAQEYMQEHPERHIHVFNSRSAAAGQVLICLKIKECAGEGMPFEQVVEQVEGYIDSLSTYFVLESLDVFRKNGRLSHLQSLAVGALHLKMVMKGDENGNIHPVGKALTVQQALNKMVQLIQEKTEGLDLSGRTLIITYVNCLERAKEVRQAILRNCDFGSALLCRSSGISTIYANNGGIIVSY